MAEPGRAYEHRQLLARIQTLEDLLAYTNERLDKLQRRIKKLEQAHGQTPTAEIASPVLARGGD